MSVLFQALDNKQECVGVYAEGRLIYDELPTELSKTWGYSAFLEDQIVEYASLYCVGSEISDMCPEELKESWHAVSDRMRAYLRSFVTSGVSLDENCFFDLVPQRYLMEFCELKNQITQHVIETHARPENYEHLLSVTKMITEIGAQQLNIKPSNIKHLRANLQARNLLKKLKTTTPHCKYNLDGTKTGRLTTNPAGFPILTLKKEHRAILEPNNDWFVELDFNAAELRVMLSLAGKPQPDIDIHRWHIENLFGKASRSEAKKRAFAWLYNPESEDFSMNKLYERDYVLKRHWDGTTVNTVFGRQIPADKFHALNYIVQSTCADMVLEQACRIRSLLADKRSTIAFIVHDSIVLDFADEDRQELMELVNEFSSTRLGKFMVNISAGKNFGKLRELRVHG